VPEYQLVELAGGAKTLFSASYGEKMHPGLGPRAEAELLYVQQLRIPERLRQQPDEFVIWDIGLGAAANAVAALHATRDIPGRLRLISFDNTTEPLEFALQHASELGYIADYEKPLAELLRFHRVSFKNGDLDVKWEFHLGDFPTFLLRSSRGNEAQTSKTRSEPPHVGCCESFPSPHAVFHDAFSPAKNPAMWTLPLFENLYRQLDPKQPCALTTYSRSTMLRATLLLAGFYVGAGPATGRKEETTVAANTPDLVSRPLDARWLERAARSDSAEPMQEPVYQRRKISIETLQKLRQHPQFQL
jgi:tRNA U34 5-methylaminomethyl-2-thiouridine-forming methyltransferase MnmC